MRIKQEENKNMLSLTRRHFMTSAAGAALAAPYIMSSSRALAQAGSITFVTWGGNYRDAIVDGALKPFTEETGIKINVIDTPDMAKIKAQVTTGNVEWDIFDAPGAMAATGAKNGYWEALPDGLLDTSDLAIAPTSDLAPFYTWTGVFAWDPAQYKQKDANPKMFADFFDTDKYPGRRAFRDRPLETFEMALLADGVAPADIYPMDIERAFRVMDRIKPDIASWTNATPQTITLLQTGEVDFSYTYATRVSGANRAGDNLKCSFEQILYGLSYLTVLKGAPNRENAFRLIAYMLQPEVQAATMAGLYNTPVSRGAMNLVPETIKPWLADVTNPNNVRINDAWWADNYDVLM